ncbi:hypothetical protein FJZ36_14215 [Candidatus Poribacteria bacterium]|nr:hypothetical protein [Candidatus Poribacteria bacterium]
MEHQQPDEGVLGKPWFMGLMLVVVVLLGIGVWWVLSNQSKIADWLHSDKPPKVEKPTVQ